MRRLFHKIYLTIIASLFMVAIVAGAGWHLGPNGSPANQAFELAGKLAAAALPPAEAAPNAQQDALTQLTDQLDADLALFDAAERLIASAGDPLPPPGARPGHAKGGWVRGAGGPAWSLSLPDRRWLVVRPQAHHRPSAFGLILFLGSIALLVALCAYPFVRGLTRRLERLQAGVETLGAGNLAARVKVEGRDEVAGLAASFNRAASRIEELVSAHRLLLANASHELRTPLSRIRLGIELYRETGAPRHKADLERDIAELDLLIDEILLASRLDAVGTLQRTEEVDLLALSAEEAARFDDCAAEGEPVIIRGEANLLRRLIRNLLENASRHGKPPIRVEVRRQGASAIVEVVDHGQGIAAAEREHIFTPFHRLKADAQGSGLGLSLVRQIARLHGGDAIVAPRPGEPSCFRVTLPLSSG
ncbi:sensor histidine kinase [Taklimakanibacter lacteus]|uniref:sensor histidine kinase n=1 Tax=Taklimakanibacter lacteus TaxID=2268456 RepID=UPI000E66B061